MPNWAKGSLKLRGKLEDIERFLKEQLVLVSREPGDSDREEERPVEFTIETEDEEIRMEGTKAGSCIWIRGMHRNFIDLYSMEMCGCNYDGFGEEKVIIPIHRFGDKNNTDAEALIVLPFKAAWSVHDEDQEKYRKFSEDYNLGIRIYVVESGWGFMQKCTYINGKTLEGTLLPEGLIGDDRYSQFVWDCPFPGLGG